MARVICLSSPLAQVTTISDHHRYSVSLLSSPATTVRDFQKLHAQFITTGLVTDPTTATHLLSFITSHTSSFTPSDVLIFLSRIPNPNSYAYTTTIQNLSRSANPHLAISLFVSMLTSSSAEPQNRTFPPLFSAYAKISHGDGKQLHGMVIKMGLADTDPVIRNSILAMYAGYGNLAACCGVFRSCLHRFDPVTWNTMITALVKSGFVEEAREVFDEIPCRDRTVVTWSTMINGYVRHKKYGLVLELFRLMQTTGPVTPNPHVIVSLLSACGALGALKQGEWAHRLIDKKITLDGNHNFKYNPHVQTALVDMYCKCGSIDKAVELFESCPSKPPSLSTWNSLIYGLGMHGRGHDSLQLFSRLVTSSGLRPDAVTFIAILTALNHSGMVDEGREIFATMTDAYGVTAGIEHYGCMIDLLGRGGFVKEAKELIVRMPMRPDLPIWGSLLAASRRIGDVETGRRAAEKVMELDPTDSSGYVVLANTYANAGEFGGALKVRVKMKERNVERVPGSSSVEVDGVVYEFVG